MDSLETHLLLSTDSYSEHRLFNDIMTLSPTPLACVASSSTGCNVSLEYLLPFPNPFFGSRALTLAEEECLHALPPVRIPQAFGCALKDTPVSFLFFTDFLGKRGGFFVRGQKT